MTVRQLGPRLATLDTRSAMPTAKTANPFYLSPEWRRFIGELIRVRGRRCQEPGCGRTNVRIFGDHVVELQDGGAPLDPANVLLRCGSCHTTKTNAERVRRNARGVGGLIPRPPAAL